jgi:hypothetical protein
MTEHFAHRVCTSVFVGDSGASRKLHGDHTALPFSDHVRLWRVRVGIVVRDYSGAEIPTAIDDGKTRISR